MDVHVHSLHVNLCYLSSFSSLPLMITHAHQLLTTYMLHKKKLNKTETILTLLTSTNDKWRRRSNGKRLLEICTTYDLVISTSTYPQNNLVYPSWKGQETDWPPAITTRRQSEKRSWCGKQPSSCGRCTETEVEEDQIHSERMSTLGEHLEKLGNVKVKLDFILQLKICFHVLVDGEDQT